MLVTVPHPPEGATVATSVPTAAVRPGVVDVPTIVQPPTITGVFVQGQTVTESHGSWTNSPTAYGYQWEDCDSAGNSCTAITGAIG